MNLIGVMQGRLSPPSPGRVQSFPANTWRQEFALAREAGLACIEWIYEFASASSNPLGSASGITEMRELAAHHEVRVRSVCADCFMERMLLTDEGRPEPSTVDHLVWLIGQAGELGCRYVVLPFVDASRLATAQHVIGLRAALAGALPAAEQNRVELHLETDLAPQALGRLLQEMNHPRLRANLDTGNSASLGHEPAVELREIGPWLGSVHIKDCVLGGGTVPLGQGGTDFETYFHGLAQLSYQGTFILQVARSTELSEVEWCRQNRRFVEELFEAAKLWSGAA